MATLLLTSSSPSFVINVRLIWILGTSAMKRVHPSGFSKRKSKLLKSQREEKQSGSLNKYISIGIRENDESSTSSDARNFGSTSSQVILENACFVDDVADIATSNDDSSILCAPIGIETVEHIGAQTEEPTIETVEHISAQTEEPTIETVEHISAQTDEPTIETVEHISAQTEEPTGNKMSEDPALWDQITEAMIEYFITFPPNQNVDKFSMTERFIGGIKRSLKEKHFYRVKRNGEKLKREWLVLSPSNRTIYCYVCKLFKTSNTALANTGFSDWKHATERIAEHENSLSHRQAICTLAARMKTSERVDSNLVVQYQLECQYWQDVLTRVVATVKFLAKRGLAFFGDNETLGSPHNGNFLGCMELISEFDPFLAKHLAKFGNPGKGHVSYLSSSIINEFISLMAKEVLHKIIEEVQGARYFSIIVDSTSDLSHIDQLAFVVRYVNDSKPVERFLKFISIQSHDAEHLTETVIATLQDCNLDIMSLRGQSYDNANNMSGKYSGLQARIKAINPLAEYIPCSAHTLNLVGVHSVESCTKVVVFFTFLQDLYNFFSASTHRWDILNTEIKKDFGDFGLTLKSHSTTRWCADAVATKSLRKNYIQIGRALILLSENPDETAVTRCEAKSLQAKLQRIETAINTVVWDAVLQRLNKANKSLQGSMEHLGGVLPLFHSLIEFVQYVRDHFEEYEQEAKLLIPDGDYQLTRKKTIPRSKSLDDKNVPQVILSSRDSFITTCHYVICDALIMQLSKRKVSYENIMQKFSFLFNCDAKDVHENAAALQQYYPEDLDDEFPDEYLQFLSLKERNQDVAVDLQNLNKLNLTATFPNVETALRIFLTLPITNCSSERSFSLLKRLKTLSRTTLGQEKLSSLALLSFESDITSSLDYGNLINKFVAQKIRKRPM